MTIILFGNENLFKGQVTGQICRAWGMERKIFISIFWYVVLAICHFSGNRTQSFYVKITTSHFFMINNVITLCKWESYNFGGGYLIRYHVMVSLHTLWTWWWSLSFTFDECFIWKWNFIFVLLMGTNICLFLFQQTENCGKKVMRKLDVDAVDGWMSCYCRVTMKIL